jgi:hypothetical protein
LTKLFVFPATDDSWFMFPSFAEHGLSPGDIVLMAIPVESVRHQSDLVVQTADRILSLIGSSGTPITFLRAHIHESEPTESAITLVKVMLQQEWDEAIVTLSDSLSSAGLVMYMAAVICASLRAERARNKIHVFVPYRAIGKRTEIPVPIIPLPSSPALLAELEKNPRAKLKDIAVKMNKHISTISRMIERDERNGFLVENDDGYVLTALGKIMVSVMGTEAPVGDETQKAKAKKPARMDRLIPRHESHGNKPPEKEGT